jgi:hypothetical protein
MSVKRVLAVLAAAFLLNTTWAQENAAESEVVLPFDAQKCILPASPDKIPEEATLEDLKAAKAQVGEFQAKTEEGNTQAIVNTYNYSVEMEERVANRFNEAVREYKERQAAGG